MKNGTLYLIPNLLGEEAPLETLGIQTEALINRLDHYFVENEKQARRFLKKAGLQKPLPEITLYPLNEHSDTRNLSSYIQVLKQGHSAGVLSDAGCPGIADPGAELVRAAHKAGIRVVPIAGPSSILLALMASGIGGQQFTFHGYLPREQALRIKRIKEMEKEATGGYSQLCMDTPYRNMHVFEDILQHGDDSTLLCIAAEITLPGEFILTDTIAGWKKRKKPDLHKKPCIFIVGRPV